jgi:hypothetical protein
MYLGWYATRQPAAVLEIIRDVARVRARELCECELTREV